MNVCVHCSWCSVVYDVYRELSDWLLISARRVTGYPRVPADRVRPGNIFSRILILPGGCIQQTVYIKVLVLAMQVFICQTCVSILDLKIRDV